MEEMLAEIRFFVKLTLAVVIGGLIGLIVIVNLLADRIERRIKESRQ